MEQVEKGKAMIEEQFGKELGYSWIVVRSDRGPLNRQELEDYQLDTELMEYALDKNERAHIEYEVEADRLLLIFNALDPIKEDNHYETTPITLIVQGNQVITIVNEQNYYLIDRIHQHLPYSKITSSYQFLFLILNLVIQEYFPILDEIDREKDRVNSRLRKQTTKGLLLELSDLETGLVYLLTASNQNVLVLEQFRKHPRMSRLTSQELEELEDALIEAQQLLAMSQLESQVLQQLSSAYDTILNNTLNENLTSLNIISILLAVLSLITGFFGMNVPLPWSEEPLAWIWLLLAFLVLWLVLARLLRSIMNRR